MKSYHCSMCNYITNNKHNYNNHLLSKAHYNNANNEDRLYTCHLCNKTFSHRSSLSRHMNHSCKKKRECIKHRKQNNEGFTSENI